VVGGVLNLPAVLPGAGWLHHWLEPVTETSAWFLPEVHLSHATEWALLGLATVIAGLGIAGAWYLLTPAGLTSAREAPPETGLQAILLRKWYVDEIYDALFVRPIHWISDRALWRSVDAGLIDGLAVNGSARLARMAGAVGSWIQSGAVGWYVFVFAVGAWWLLRTIGGS
jgi:NADH-quinone oxidoreductase subunit L